MSARPALAILISAALPAVCGCTQEQLEDLLFDTYLVKLDAEPAEVVTTVNDIAEVFEIEPIHIFTQATQGFSVDLPVGVADQIQAWDGVDYIIIDNPDRKAPDDDWDEPDLGDDEVPAGVARIGGPVTSVDLSGVAVAVVDTGVDLDHPDLNVIGAKDIVAEAGGNDRGGDDGYGHGTHVAGIIGAVADGAGVAGVAPGVGIYAVRVLGDDGGGTYGDVIAGLDWVLSQPDIKVVNLSLGCPGDPGANSMLDDAIQALLDADVVVCIAAGNDGADTATFIPAGYDLGVVVSAYDADGGDNGFAWFSNYGDAVDIAAPGVSITSTYLEGSYVALSGTSMATPHVAGAAAAYMAKNPSAGPDDFFADLLSSGEDGYQGQGGDHPEPLLDVSALIGR
ncbi:MAG: S8 family serine peptidase [Pseudomonadota bacterium]